MIGRTNVGGSSGDTGATLVVSAPADVTVTATKDNKTYTRIANSDGIATFKGLSSGTWALSMSDSSHDPTTPVDVIITTDYYVTLAFFAAVINITYPAGSTCKAVHTDGTELTAPDTSGTWSCIVPSAGTWTVSCTDGTNSKSESVEITSEGQSESVTLNYSVEIFNGGAIVPFTAKNAENATVTIANEIVFSSSGGAYNKGALAYTTDKVDLTDYNTIVFEGAFTEVVNSNADKSRVGIMETAAQNQSNWVASTELDITKNSWTVDVSSKPGSYHICAFAGNGYVDALKGSITRIYLV